MGATPRAPAHLGTRGRRLWRELAAGGALTAADAVLAEEACRIADRLDRLDALLRGDVDAWAYIDYPDNGPVRLVVNSALAESRQQAAVLKTICAELRQSARKAGADKAVRKTASTPEGTGSGVPGVASLTERIAQRRAGGAPPPG
jgi:hypothetical protein